MIHWQDNSHLQYVVSIAANRLCFQSELDWSVGEVFKTLESSGVADNTFVFFTSDNG